MSKILKIIVTEANQPSEKALQLFTKNCYQYIRAIPEEEIDITIREIPYSTYPPQKN